MIAKGTCLGVAMLLASAWQPSTPAPVNVTLEFLATTTDGRPIRDLGIDDVTLKLDGRTRTVRSLQFVEIGSNATPDGSPAGSPAPPPPFVTNVGAAGGRSFVLIVDDESVHVGEERRIRDTVGQLLTELPPRDRVALVTVPHGSVTVDFTSDFAQVRRRLAQLVGLAPSNLTAADAACRTRNVLEAVTGVLDSLEGPSGPTTVMLLSNGLVGLRSEAIRRPTVALGSPAVQGIGMCELTSDHFANVALAVASAHAFFYVVQAEQVSGGSISATAGPMFGGSDNPLSGLENLAGVTGGSVRRLATGGDNDLLRVMRETSAYYVASFQPDRAEWNGAAHRLDIRPARSGVELRAGSSIRLARVDARAVAVPAPGARDVLRDTKRHAGLPLRGTTYTSRDAAGAVRILGTFESLDPASRITAAAAALFNRDGKLIGQWTGAAADLAQRPLVASLVAPTGAYRLRMAATDADGRTGAVDCDVDAALTAAGPLRLSSLALGLLRPEGFLPRLEFGTELVAVGSLELYGTTGGTAVRATIEVAATEDGPALLTLPVGIAATQDPDRFVINGAIPVRALAPGDYAVRVTIGLDGQPAGRVVRTLRKR